MLSSNVARQLKRRKVYEDDVLRDFEVSRKKRRAARRGCSPLSGHRRTRGPGDQARTGRAGLHPAAAYDEVFEYLAPPAKKKRLHLDTLLLTLAALPVTVVERSEYERHLPVARRRMGKRDPDDAAVLALALDLNLPVWSNDNDFVDAGVEWHTTAELLKALGIRSV